MLLLLLFYIVLQFSVPGASGELLSAQARPGEQARQVADQWPQFRGDARLTGVSESRLAANLHLAWTFEAGESIESSAAIVDGAVYVGSQSGDLLAVDLATGKLRWKYRAQEAIGESSPAVSEGLVYIGDLKGVLHAVDAQTGKGVWTFATRSEIKSSPVVVAGKVLVGSYDGNFYAVAARTGKLAWKVQTDGPVHSTASVTGGVAYITGCDETFRAVRISDGKVLFQVAEGAYTGASPALLVRSSQVVAYFGTFNNDVQAVNLTGRRLLWRYENPDRQFPFNSSAAIADGKVVVGGRDKVVHALDTRTGKALWTFATRARVESSPAIAGGRVYVGSHDGRLYVLDLASGKQLWEFEAGAPLSASPAIAEGSVVIGSQDGQLFCFR